MLIAKHAMDVERHAQRLAARKHKSKVVVPFVMLSL